MNPTLPSTLLEAWAPFQDFGFMRRSLAACLALGLGCGPVGVLLTLRRMSLMGDALSHALLPGAALGFLWFGLSLTALSIGALVAGLVVALGAGAVARWTPQREDTSFAAFYLSALAAGVMLISTQATQVDLLHVLFGSVLAVDDAALQGVATITTLTLVTLAVLWRPLLVDTLDPDFLHAVGGPAMGVQTVFLALVVCNLVSAFQAMGTMMAVGLMMLPAAAARFWVQAVAGQCTVAAVVAAGSGAFGLHLSYVHEWPSGPSIVLVASAVYALSVIFGPQDGLAKQGWQVLQSHTLRHS